MRTQEEIDTEAREIMQRIVRRHKRTWDELARISREGTYLKLDDYRYVYFSPKEKK
jgi:hypothetical protein